jgi:predicted RNase H-like nuclease (RuvC/YqgF family)
MTDSGIQQAAIKKLEAENKTLKAKVSRLKNKNSKQAITLKHLVESENELLRDTNEWRNESDKEIDRLMGIIESKGFCAESN